MKPKRPRSSVMFFTFAAWSIGATAVSLLTSGVGAEGHAKFAREQKAAAERCEAAPHADPWCTPESPGPPVFALYQSAKSSLDGRFGYQGEAVVLARTIERAGMIGKAGTPISALAAAKLIDEAGDRLDRDAALLADEDVGRALETTTLEAAKHPFAFERAHALASLTKVPGQGRVPNTPLAQAATGVFMKHVDDTLTKMEKATLAGNVGSCMRAVEEAGPLVRVVVSGPAACTNADRVVRAGKRLASLRVRASVAAANRSQYDYRYRKM